MVHIPRIGDTNLILTKGKVADGDVCSWNRQKFSLEDQIKDFYNFRKYSKFSTTWLIYDRIKKWLHVLIQQSNLNKKEEARVRMI